MRIKIEFALAAIVATACWLWFFPAIGATSADLPPWSLAVIIPAYAAVTTLMFQGLYGALIILGARFPKWKQTLIFATAVGAQLLPQYLICVLLGLAIPELVVSYAWFALAVTVAAIAQCLLMVAFGSIRDKADTREMLSHTTLRVWTHGCYLPVLKGDKLVDGERLLIRADQLDRTETLIKSAWEAMTRRDWESADRFLIDAIPQLKNCGCLGVLRVDAACRVMVQSHEALGNQVKVAEYVARIKHLSLVFKETGAF